jgi:hypothetical protein
VNRKLFVAFAALTVVAMLVAPVVSAKPWAEKNNEKFQSFLATFVFDETFAQNLELNYKPSEDEPNIIVATWEENYLDYSISIDGSTYHLGTDFERTGYVRRTAIGAPFIYFPFDVTGAPFGSIITHSRVEFMFDFSAVSGGIDGTLEMLSSWNVRGETVEISIRSLRGTGDLQNVQIQATSGLPSTIEGIVIGWPDIPPA